MNNLYDVVIVGAGPGGLTAGLYAARAGRRVLVLEKLSAGGQMALTTQIDNYPGFPEGVDGFDLATQMLSGAEKYGVQMELAEVTSLQLREDPKVIHTDMGVFYGKTVIIATGADPRKLGIPGEERAHYCAHCDGMRYKGKTVAVVGGGNSAAADALLLSTLAKKVYVIHRRDSLRATKIYHEPLEKAENVEFVWESVPKKLLRDAQGNGILEISTKAGELRQLSCDGLFVSIGRVPATALVAGQLTLDEGGYIVADESTRTSLPGVFAVGDVRTKPLRQVVTAVADGAMAAEQAEEFLRK